MDERQNTGPAAGGEGAEAQRQPRAPEDELAALRAEAARYKEEAERNWQQFLHAAADLENYKKQASRQREDAVQRARFAVLAAVLTVVDNLERALGHSTGGDDDKIVAGIRITHRHALEVLAKMGVTQMETVGQKFDPRYHEAVDVVASVESGVEPGTIVSEMQRGYFVNGDVLRHAKVRVAK